MIWDKRRSSKNISRVCNWRMIIIFFYLQAYLRELPDPLFKTSFVPGTSIMYSVCPYTNTYFGATYLSRIQLFCVFLYLDLLLEQNIEENSVMYGTAQLFDPCSHIFQGTMFWRKFSAWTSMYRTDAVHDMMLWYRNLRLQWFLSNTCRLWFEPDFSNLHETLWSITIHCKQS